MTVLVRRFVNSGVLLIWGVVMAYFYFSGRIDSYLAPGFHLPVLICALVLVAMAVAMLVVPADSDCGDAQCCGAISAEPIRLRTVLAWTMLCVPLLVAVRVSPSQFGATTLLNRGLITDASALPASAGNSFVEPPLPGETAGAQPVTSAMDSSTYLVKNAKGQIKTEPIDLLFAAQEVGLRPDFENKEIEVVGQFLPAKVHNAKGSRFLLSKLYITCCANDGRGMVVTVQAPGRETFPEMTWLKVTGIATFPLEDGKRIPVIVADSIQPTEPPAEPVNY